MTYLLIPIILLIILYYNKRKIYIIDYSKCANGSKPYLFFINIRNDILRLNNYSIRKSINFIKKEFSYMRRNTDSLSKSNLNEQMSIIENNIICNNLIKDFTIEQKRNYEIYLKLLSTYRATYNIEIFYPQVFYYKHGMIYFTEKQLKYIYIIEI